MNHFIVILQMGRLHSNATKKILALFIFHSKQRMRRFVCPVRGILTGPKRSVRLLGHLHEGFPQIFQLPSQGPGIGIQLGLQLLPQLGESPLELLGVQVHLGAQQLLHTLLHLLPHLLGEGDHLGLQLLDAPVQLFLQLGASLDQGLGVYGASVRLGLPLELLHLPAHLGHHLLGVGLHLVPEDGQLGVHAGLQPFGLLGEARNNVLADRTCLGAHGVGEPGDGVCALA